MKSLGVKKMLIGIPAAWPHSRSPSSGRHPVFLRFYIPDPSVLSADNKQPNKHPRVTKLTYSHSAPYVCFKA